MLDFSEDFHALVTRDLRVSLQFLTVIAARKLTMQTNVTVVVYATLVHCWQQ